MLRSLLLFLAVLSTVSAQTPRLVTWFEPGRGTTVALATNAGSNALRVTDALVLEAMVVAVPGTDALIANWVEVIDGLSTEWCSTSANGREFAAPVRMETTIALRYGAFEPLRAAPPAVAAELAASQGSRILLVQFRSPTTDALLQMLAQLGVQRHAYLPHNAAIVEGDPAALTALRFMPCVRWAGPFHPAYKLDESLRAELSGMKHAPSHWRVNALSMARGREGQRPALELLQRLGARILEADPQTWLFGAALDRSALIALAHSDAVQWIDPRGEPGVDMDIARQFHGAATVDALGFDGTGVRGEVLDVGTDVTHPEFVGAPIAHGALINGNHGTCTYGEVFGNGTAAQAKGILHNGTGIAGYYAAYVGGSRYAHTADLINNLQGVFQTNSWGSSLTTSYNATSQSMDTLLFDLDIVVTQSQSNAGTQSSRPEAWAKNIVSVGGIRHLGTLTKTDDNWSGASIGPAADGRLKPDLASFYDAIYTSDQVGAAGYATGDYYSAFGGTSGATPIVAGCMGILHQMWHQGIFGNPTSTSVFASRPHAATAKALLINTATQWTFSGTTANLSRYKQGWGHPDLATLYNDRNKLLIVNESTVLANAASASWTVTVAAGQPHFQATLVWRDRPGTTSATQHRINNLDLKVTAPNGTIYWGNNGLAAGNYSTSGGTANTVDTVENVILANPAAGTWTVMVTAAQLNQDGHVATPALDSAFGLVVRGGTTAPPPFSLELTAPAGAGSLHFGINGIPAAATEGFTLFSFDTTAPVGTGMLLGLNADLLTITCMQEPLAAGSLIHWDWPVAGVYPAVDIDLPAGSVAFPPGFSADGVAVAIGVGNAILGSTPAVRITF